MSEGELAKLSEAAEGMWDSDRRSQDDGRGRGLLCPAVRSNGSKQAGKASP